MDAEAPTRQALDAPADESLENREHLRGLRSLSVRQVNTTAAIRPQGRPLPTVPRPDTELRYRAASAAFGDAGGEQLLGVNLPVSAAPLPA